ncbi:ubiquitin-like domain-containing protein [Promicromonospora kroppenstedtii]|uniref:aggregation-promoting factor C-terminal-like domain-containing protein n=1 Tax=Promicromonospora kroppenstedtii TaxID=440482 RepID=UPI001FE026B1|nr:ubiquitin-like domain-containing protein [Promicromonospora kroppenstedtii]
MRYARPWLASKPARWLVRGVVVGMLAGVSGVYVANAATLTIDYNGDVRTVGVYGSTVAEALASQHIDLERDDVVQPAATSAVGAGGTVVVRTSRDVTVELDGQIMTLRTTAGTVGELLAALGPRGDGAVATASRTTQLDRDPVRFSTVKEVNIAVDGSVLEFSTTGSTVRSVFEEAGIALAKGDVTSVPLDAAAVDGMIVMVSRDASSSRTVTEVVPFETETVEDPSLPQGYESIRTAGVAGEAKVTYEVKTVGGAVVERTLVGRKVTREPVNEVLVVGTMDVATAPVDPGSARALGQAMAAERGWGADEFSCLDQLWEKESGWRWNADNPSSEAYGIAQANPGSKMATVGSDWLTNPATQIEWGLGYISGRYGTPCGAWAHSVDIGWY